MAEAHSLVAEQFDDLPQQREASTLGMWTFLATEILFFGGLFLGYITYRSAYPQAFAEASRHTVVLLGTVNTAILLTSSLFMALAVRAAQLNRQRGIVFYLLLTVFLGVCFLGVKGYEYHEDLQEHLLPGRSFRTGLPPQGQIFWFLYWAMTGLHAVHVTIGVGLLSVVTVGAWQGRFSDRYHNPVEISGLYWHFVDLVWVFVFTCFYLF